MKNFVIYELDEDFNFSNFQKIEQEVLSLLDKQYEYDFVILDFKKTERIDKVGVGSLINLSYLFKKINKFLILKSCNFIIKRHFELCNLLEIFIFYEDLVQGDD